jgi:hypothetical protein
VTISIGATRARSPEAGREALRGGVVNGIAALVLMPGTIRREEPSSSSLPSAGPGRHFLPIRTFPWTRVNLVREDDRPLAESKQLGGRR